MITSRDNPRIKAARGLQQRRERRRAGLLLVEGARLLEDAWRAGFRPQVVFYDDEALGPRSPGRPLLGEFAVAGVECLACTPGAFADLTETVTPQGIAAVLPLPALAIPADADLLLILDGVSDPGNAGTLLRSAEAVGVQGVLFAPNSVDPFNGKVVRSGMGAHFRLPIRDFTTWPDLLASLPASMVLHVADASGTQKYDEVDWTASCALIVGGEAAGPSAEARAAATAIYIPMQGRVESLNAAMAGTVILFEAARRRRSATP